MPITHESKISLLLINKEILLTALKSVCVGQSEVSSCTGRENKLLEALLSGSAGSQRKRKAKAMVGSVCQYAWCKCSHYDQL